MKGGSALDHTPKRSRALEDRGRPGRLRLPGKLRISGPLLTSFETTSLASAGFCFRDDFLPGHLASRIRSEALSLVSKGALRAAGIGRDGKADASIRGDHLCWLERSNADKGTQALMAVFERLRQAMNRDLYLGLARYEMQLAQYHAGSAGYSKHLDAFRGGQNRRLTAIYYLNPSWRPGHGGELSLYLAGGEIKLEPLQNRLLIFLSEEVEHAVLPVNASRLALTAWFHSS